MKETNKGVREKELSQSPGRVSIRTCYPLCLKKLVQTLTPAPVSGVPFFFNGKNAGLYFKPRATTFFLANRLLSFFLCLLLIMSSFLFCNCLSNSLNSCCFCYVSSSISSVFIICTVVFNIFIYYQVFTSETAFGQFELKRMLQTYSCDQMVVFLSIMFAHVSRAKAQGYITYSDLKSQPTKTSSLGAISNDIKPTP